MNSPGVFVKRAVAIGCVISWSVGAIFAFEPLLRAEPGDVGINAVQLDVAIEAMGQVHGMWAVVVARKGMVVAEDHFVDPPDALHPVWSVTKSVSSTLVGMAIDRGFIEGVEDVMVDYLPSGLDPADPSADRITLRHLLMMTSGLRWSEETDWLPWLRSSNPARYILDRSVVSSPGLVFNYSSASAHLPSLILTEALVEDPAEFAQSQLFEPLGISDWGWDRDPQNYPFGGHGIKMRTEDLAKLGILFLRKGRWQGRQVVSREWVEEAVQPRFFWDVDYGPLNNVDYGYLWWTAEAGGYPVFIAWGWGGQFAFCVPDLDLVVATAADGWVGTAEADHQERAILTVIVEQILPIVNPRWGVPMNDPHTVFLR
jgi:CubicO group peptidase (beta-lactamase class C family)